MSTLIVAVHAAHYAAMMSLVGGFGFLLFIALPAGREAGGADASACRRLNRFLLRLIAWSLVLSLLTGALWFGAQAASMSGLPLEEALAPRILATVLLKTLFGQVWLARASLALGLGVLLLVVRSPKSARGWQHLGVAGGVLAATVLAAIALVGHANSENGTEHLVHIAADMVHLLASAAWLGALLPLAYALTPPRHGAGSDWLRVASIATRRFSTVGVVSVASLVLTGLVNSWFLVGNVPGLVGTTYGRLLLVKLALFLAMLSLAAVNRQRLTPRLLSLPGATPADAMPQAVEWLRRNALIENSLGVALLVVLAALATSVPAVHTQPIWPFSITLNAAGVALTPIARVVLMAAMAAGALALAATALAVWRRRWRFAAVAVAAAMAAAFVSLRPFIVEAYPTSYIHSPVRYDALSIARGEPIYRENCTACHGAEGYGDGPAAAALTIKPANLTGEHLFHHGEGTLFWWVSNGIAGTPMPGFGSILSDSQRWDVLTFLRAQADAEQANIMNANVEPWRPVVAPDFTFQIGERGQETLKQQRGRAIVLLVLFSEPASIQRLRELDESAAQLDRAGVRIIAVPMLKDPTAADSTTDLRLRRLTIAEAGPETVAAYGLFRRTASIDGVPAMPPHMEFLIDRQGYLRFRWSPEYGAGWNQVADLLKRVDFLNHETPRPPAPEGHVH